MYEFLHLSSWAWVCPIFVRARVSNASVLILEIFCCLMMQLLLLISLVNCGKVLILEMVFLMTLRKLRLCRVEAQRVLSFFITASITSGVDCARCGLSLRGLVLLNQGLVLHLFIRTLGRLIPCVHISRLLVFSLRQSVHIITFYLNVLDVLETVSICGYLNLYLALESPIMRLVYQFCLLWYQILSMIVLLLDQVIYFDRIRDIIVRRRTIAIDTERPLIVILWVINFNL